MKNSLIAMGLGLVAGLITASFALADDNYYVCYNQDPTSSAPANVLVMATSQGMAGLMNGANVNPPRALFQAPAADVSNPSSLSFGPVAWQGKSNGFSDFQSATADFDASGAMTKASFTYSGKTANYAKCIVDSDS